MSQEKKGECVACRSCITGSGESLSCAQPSAHLGTEGLGWHCGLVKTIRFPQPTLWIQAGMTLQISQAEKK